MPKKTRAGAWGSGCFSAQTVTDPTPADFAFQLSPQKAGSVYSYVMLKDADTLEQAIRADGRYAIPAFEFLLRGLEYTAEHVHGPRKSRRSRHVSGEQLCEGLREYALKRWGFLATVVLEHWGIRSTRDFGEMVFLLIGLGALGKQDEDQIEDFDDVYCFQDAFAAYAVGSPDS